CRAPGARGGVGAARPTWWALHTRLVLGSAGTLAQLHPEITMSWKPLGWHWPRKKPAKKKTKRSTVLLDLEALEERRLFTTVQFYYSTWNISNQLTNASLMVLLSDMPSQNVTVHYSTSDGTAEAGEDYTSSSG